MKRLGIAMLAALAALGGIGPSGVAWADPDPGTSPSSNQAEAVSPRDIAPTLAQLRVSWRPRREGGAPTIGGWVHNDSAFRVSDVRLRVEGLDARQRPVGETFAWAEGDILPGGRTYFVVPTLPEATAYRVHVVSFDVVSHGD